VSHGPHEPASDIDTAVVDSLKALDPNRPIREAGVARVEPASTRHLNRSKCPPYQHGLN
jgi:hypothetical protein